MIIVLFIAVVGYGWLLWCLYDGMIVVPILLAKILGDEYGDMSFKKYSTPMRFYLVWFLLFNLVSLLAVGAYNYF